MAIYHETFDEGPGGWYGYQDLPGQRMGPLEWRAGELTSRSPWWIDYNHAPPGAGYFHMLYCLNTFGPQTEEAKDLGGPNRFIAEKCPIDFTSARITTRVRGEVRAQGAKLSVLLQGYVDGICSGWVRTGDTFDVGEEWCEKTVSLDPDPAGWTPLGSRHDRTDMYGVKPLEKVLSNVGGNIMLLLFPIDVSPMGPIDGDMHILRAERDYPVWRHKLPEGYVSLSSVRIEFPH
jgi:hypothetical protein